MSVYETGCIVISAYGTGVCMYMIAYIQTAFSADLIRSFVTALYSSPVSICTNLMHTEQRQFFPCSKESTRSISSYAVIIIILRKAGCKAIILYQKEEFK